MELNESFSKNTNFSLLTEIKPFFIKNVFQKTCLEIDEKGTTAASGTIVEMTLGISSDSIEMKCERPFLIFLSKYSSKMKKDIIL